MLTLAVLTYYYVTDTVNSCTSNPLEFAKEYYKDRYEIKSIFFHGFMIDEQGFSHSFVIDNRSNLILKPTFTKEVEDSTQYRTRNQYTNNLTIYKPLSST